MGPFLVLVGSLGFVVAAVALIRGRLRWARIGSRRRAGIALLASFIVLSLGTALSPASPGATKAAHVAGSAQTPPTSSAPVKSASVATAAATSASSAVSSSAKSRSSANAAPATPIAAPSSVLPRPSVRSLPSSPPIARSPVMAGGVVLPDRARTPGSRFGAATVSAICRSGYSATVRSVSESKRRTVYASYGVAWADRGRYEVDHLIPLELGGDNSMANLWPEPQDGARAGYATKDGAENHLHALVCAGTVPLRTAQRAIASNWYTAYHRYSAVSAARPTPSPDPAPQPAPVAHTTAPSRGCTTTSSGSCIKGGQFCRQALYGQTGTDAMGRTYKCTGDASHPHWE